MGPVLLVLVLLTLFLIIVHLPQAPLTGATVTSGDGYQFVVEQTFTRPAVLEVGLMHSPASVAVSAEVEGQGSVVLYLQTADGLKRVFGVDGETTASARHLVLKHACDQTCTGVANNGDVFFQIVVNGATLTLHNITYTTRVPSTGAAVADISPSVLPCQAYEWLQAALTVLAILFLFFGPVRDVAVGRKASRPAVLAILALVAATGLLALIDAINCNMIPVVVLIAAVVCIFVLDAVLLRSRHRPRPLATNRLDVFAPGDGLPDEREIRRQLENIRRRLAR
jgi:hypothetical protein